MTTIERKILLELAKRGHGNCFESKEIEEVWHMFQNLYSWERFAHTMEYFGIQGITPNRSTFDAKLKRKSLIRISPDSKFAIEAAAREVSKDLERMAA